MKKGILQGKTPEKSRPQKVRKRPAPTDVRTGTDAAAVRQAIVDNLYCVQGRVPEIATRNDWYMAVAYTVRDRMMGKWIQSLHDMVESVERVVGYLSAEFLLGPHLGNCLLNLGIYDQFREAVSELGQDLDDIIGHEQEPGLGNGGLGRLAACFLDSLTTLDILAIAYGIRYEFGIFDQVIHDGWQDEKTDKWLALGNPWEIARPEIAYDVNLGGHTESDTDDHGRYRVRWVPWLVVRAIAYDTPIVGYRSNLVNVLRLWRSEACESFDFDRFNVGDYYGAVEEKMASETISKVLYPNDEPAAGKQLRLAQQYFFVSASLQDMLRIYLLRGGLLEQFHNHFTVQLNDTHPSIAVAELMRLLVDVHLMPWETAWHVTYHTFGYTNHTLLPEALEKWPLPIFREVLPRHLEIIYEINRRFLDEVRIACPGDDARLARLSIIDEAGNKYVRMANLASIGSHAINGVAALHSELLKETVLKDFYDLDPGKFHNVTNGVTPRRWVVLSNPRLAGLITRATGDRWIADMEDYIHDVEKFSEDAGFRGEWREIKVQNKTDLAAIIKDHTGATVDPRSLFDVQVKRIHEYKRQHLNILHVITRYLRIKREGDGGMVPRTFVFGGKAAPGYAMAKLIIKLINSVAEVINVDPDVNDRLKVAFVPDFNVKSGQHIYPAADLSEQISTAGKEASGTGNMKFSMSGALTIGTLDGANVEIREEVGPENFFLFGLTADEVGEMKARGYKPMDYYNSNGRLREVLDLISSGVFSRGDRNLFKPLVDSLLYDDQYMLLADYQSYIDCQDDVDRAFRDEERWTAMSILNVARMGKFSSDRSIREYAEKIWRVKPLTKSG
jgi:starch phosphorylase